MFCVLWLTESKWLLKLPVAQFISIIDSSFRAWDSSQGIFESIQTMKINICSQLPIWWITVLMSQWIYPYFNTYRVWMGHIWSCSVLAADGGNYSKFLSPLHSLSTWGVFYIFQGKWCGWSYCTGPLWSPSQLYKFSSKLCQNPQGIPTFPGGGGRKEPTC